MIVQDVWLSIRKARVVVADLSGGNPNVLYEVGLAHAIGKPTVFLTRNEEDVPFDLRALRYLYYDINNPFWGDDLRARLVGLVRQAIASSAPAHLQGIVSGIKWPAITPKPPKTPEDALAVEFVGTWSGSWLSIQAQRKHNATLVIPAPTGRNITAEMTVDYLREDAQTIVRETLRGIVDGTKISLTGVDYTYEIQGNSRAYSLDSFELKLSEDKASLVGAVILKRGKREIAFQRVPAGV